MKQTQTSVWKPSPVSTHPAEEVEETPKTFDETQTTQTQQEAQVSMQERSVTLFMNYFSNTPFTSSIQHSQKQYLFAVIYYVGNYFACIIIYMIIPVYLLYVYICAVCRKTDLFHVLTQTTMTILTQDSSLIVLTYFLPLLSVFIFLRVSQPKFLTYHIFQPKVEVRWLEGFDL